jgi:DNA-binding NarL/FixJ family response regulator
MTYAVGAAVGVLVALVGAQSWCLWRLVGRMRVLPRVEERVATLVHTVGLLTDTTEACFQSVAARLGGEGPSAGAEAAGRLSRQRRVLGAARRGQAASEIAAQEELAESEVRLRLHMGR